MLFRSPLEVETFTGSITDAANLDLAMRDCDAVIHLAAVADVAIALRDGRVFSTTMGAARHSLPEPAPR